MPTERAEQMELGIVSSLPPNRGSCTPMGSFAKDPLQSSQLLLFITFAALSTNVTPSPEQQRTPLKG
jgi:hypothetical protein